MRQATDNSDVAGPSGLNSDKDRCVDFLSAQGNINFSNRFQCLADALQDENTESNTNNNNVTINQKAENNQLTK